MRKSRLLLPILCVTTLLSTSSCDKAYVFNEDLKQGDVISGEYTQKALGPTTTLEDKTKIEDKKYHFLVNIELGAPLGGSETPTIKTIALDEDSVTYKPVGYIDAAVTGSPQVSSFTETSIAQLKLDTPVLLNAFVNKDIKVIYDYVANQSTSSSSGLYFVEANCATSTISNVPGFNVPTLLNMTSAETNTTEGKTRVKIATNVLVGTYLAVIEAITK